MRDFVPEGEDDDWLDHFPLYNPPTIRNALKNLCALRVPRRHWRILGAHNAPEKTVGPKLSLWL